MRPRSNRAALTVALAAAGLLAACASKPPVEPEPPTLKSLAGRKVEVDIDRGVEGTDEKAISAYRKFLESAPNAPQRNEAMRRLGDLEMDVADSAASEGKTASGAPDYKAAVTRYRDYLKTYPNDPGNDRVLYQIARAQEQSGELEAALKTLDQLVQKYPQTTYLEEAEFRRGELLFAMRDYVKAEQAYTTVLTASKLSSFHDRALYMQGWSRFKQNRIEEALYSFFEVLDLKVANRAGGLDLDSLRGLSRADLELIEDTFRVTSLCLANLNGAATIPQYIISKERTSYEFRIYQQLAELYLKQERVKDAADTMSAFAKRDPMHEQAPAMQSRVIEIYQNNGFPNLALDAKKDYVSRYGVDSEFHRVNPIGWREAEPLVKVHLAELAKHYHASAQKTKSTADYQEAVKWYRAYLTSFPTDPEAAQNNFLLAELLREDKRFAEAATEYEKTAYGYRDHPKAADAGYSALLSYAAQEKAAPQGSAATTLQRTAVDSSLRFAKAFPKDTRTAAVLTDTAEKLYALRDTSLAASVAEDVLRLDNPPATAAQRRVAFTVVGHTSFDAGRFDRAEKAYAEVLALTPEKEAGRNELVERLAASVYKQGEQARSAGRLQEAVGHFNRVAQVAPQSPVRATAQFDAAASMIALKDWDGAKASLEDFRKRYPNHPLQADVNGKLAAIYMEKGDWAQAAGEFERFAATQKDPKLAKASLWQAAELYEKGAEKDANARVAATRTYERYLKQYNDSLETSLEVRWRLSKLAKLDGNAARELSLAKEIYQADQAGGAARTNRTRFLGANAALAMAEPTYNEYRKVQLIEPLAKQLKLKKARMEDTLKAYTVAANYGVADVTTAATYRIAALYQDFGKAMMTSQRPKKLSKLELEQYNVLLEEQAYPFEEKAMEVHELNAKRAGDGIFDEWVQKSYAALKEMRPVRYGKSERSEATVDAIR